MEGQIGWFRRNHLVPVPDVPSVQALNAMIDEWDVADEARRIGSRARTVGEFLAIERPLLGPLPLEPVETGRWFTPRVDRFAQVTVRTNKYSVPVRLIGRGVRVLLHASTWSSTTGAPRSSDTSGCPVSPAPASTWTTTWRCWSASLAHCPDRPRWNRPAPPGSSPWSTTPGGRPPAKPTATPPGTRALVEVLLLHQHMDSEHVVAGLAAALRAGALTADAVALEARKAADEATGQPGRPGQGANPATPPAVASLTARRLEKLPPDTRPLPSVAAYDQLLRRTRIAQEGNTRP